MTPETTIKEMIALVVSGIPADADGIVLEQSTLHMLWFPDDESATGLLHKKFQVDYNTITPFQDRQTNENFVTTEFVVRTIHNLSYNNNHQTGLIQANIDSEAVVNAVLGLEIPTIGFAASWVSTTPERWESYLVLNHTFSCQYTWTIDTDGYAAAPCEECEECAECEDCPQECYDSGFDAGYLDGYVDGTAYGEQLAYQPAYDAGYVDGSAAGYIDGYSDGTEYGEQIAYEPAFDAGYDSGYTAGYTDGYGDCPACEPIPASWIPITQWGSLVDTGSTSDTGTAHNGTGTLTIVYKGDSTVYDGFREAAPSWEAQITAIPGLETWTPNTGILQVLFKPNVPIDTGSVGDNYGIAVAMVDTTLANIATSSGIGFRLARFNASINQVQNISTNSGTGATSSSNADYVILTYDPSNTATTTTYVVSTKGRSAVDTWGNFSSAVGTAMSPTAANHYIRVKGHHGSTTTNPGLTVSAQVWIRWLRSEGELEGI